MKYKQAKKSSCRYVKMPYETEPAGANGYFSVATFSGGIIAFGRTIEDCVKNSMQALKDETCNLIYIEITGGAFFEMIKQGRVVETAVRTPGKYSDTRKPTMHITADGTMRMTAL